MYILVVDDEPLIHLSIEKLMQMCSKNDTILHVYNGNQMLETIRQHEFSLALVDIKMPGLSGLEAIRQAKEISPQTRYYIMTGFDEFEYAKQAVKLKVDDYLMKPLDLKTINEVLAAGGEQQQQLCRSREELLRRWLQNTVDDHEALAVLEGYFVALAVLVSDSGNAVEPVSPVMAAMAGSAWVSVRDKAKTILLVYGRGRADVEQLLCQLTSPPANGVTGFVSGVLADATQYRMQLEALLQSSSLRVLLKQGCSYPVAQLHSFSTLQANFCRSCLQWQQAWYDKDFTTFSAQSELLVGQLYKHRELLQHGADVQAFVHATLGVGDGRVLPSKQELREELSHAARCLLSSPSQEDKVQAIIRFIQEHYHQNLSAAELSERFGLSPNHIANLLKGALGVRYNEYVTQLRMGRAKELLLSSQQSVKEITAACGYFSQSHFIKLFVDHEGCTPSEYRKQHIAP